MNIVIIADSKYAMQSAVTLQSFFLTNGKGHLVYLISTGMNTKDIHNLQRICESFKSYFFFVKIDESLLDSFDGLSGWSKFTFMKILIPDVVPENIDRILYLDVDILVCGDLSNLYASLTDNMAVCGVEDIPYQKESKERCGIESKSPYINSGVMMMNLNIWRERMIEFDILCFINSQKEKGFTVNDQDVINVMFENQIKAMPFFYNVTNLFYGIHSPVYMRFKDEWKNGRRKPVVIHFTNNRKPWYGGVTHPYKKQWLDILRQTPYKMNNLKFNYMDIKNQAIDGLAVIVDWFRMRL